jgi:NAD(P)-dependent dehydrogenase (short-subunit alcohol dehydrogenase family)
VTQQGDLTVPESSRVALVTEAASGIGRASAIALSARGLHVVIADLDLDGGRRVVEELLGPAGLAVRADMSSATDVADLVDATRGEFGRLDVMVDNAGSSGPGP